MEVGSYTYLLGGLIFLPWWLVLFFWNRTLRDEMLIMSFLIGMLAPLWAPFFFDYWSPIYLVPIEVWSIQLGSVEDFIYGFLIGGIASVIYELAFPRKILKLRDKRHHWKWFVIPLIVIAAFSFHGLLWVGWNSIYASFIMFLALAVFMCWFRHDLIFNAAVTGLLVLGITFVGYLVWLALFPTLIQEWWHMEQISGSLLYGIPLEELAWAFTLGLVGGPFYEFIMGIRFSAARRGRR
ncbi:MAG TPA: lycopene cyclase domain-containing protein [Candidatus Paceibacterota bacterium]|nr:lycopene cyclase domain-containing protein [Candidatus Paceibacterota bacterium]